MQVNSIENVTVSSKATSSREAILDAAANVIVNSGVLSLTIDAVAKAAGLSKGGVLYHFSSKEALLRGMLEFHVGKFVEDIRAHATADPVPTGRWTRSYLKVSLHPCDGPESERTTRLFASLLGVLALQPELISTLDPLMKLLNDGIKGDGAPLSELQQILAASDGIWFWSLLGLKAFEEGEREPVVSALIARTYQGATSPETTP